MIGQRLDGKCVMAMLIVSAGLLLAGPAAYGAGTITITKAVMVEKDEPHGEVTSGYADADHTVDFKGDAVCSCECDDATLTYTWNFDDDTTADGKNASHSYGLSGAGNRAPWLHVECTCTKSANSDALSVSAIHGFNVTLIGDKPNPTNDGRLSFNNELHVAATATPAGVNGSHMIDWCALVSTYHIELANTAAGVLPNLQPARAVHAQL